jgi:hypothetical protein
LRRREAECELGFALRIYEGRQKAGRAGAERYLAGEKVRAWYFPCLLLILLQVSWTALHRAPYLHSSTPRLPSIFPGQRSPARNTAATWLAHRKLIQQIAFLMSICVSRQSRCDPTHRSSRMRCRCSKSRPLRGTVRRAQQRGQHRWTANNLAKVSCPRDDCQSLAKRVQRNPEAKDPSQRPK